MIGFIKIPILFCVEDEEMSEDIRALINEGEEIETREMHVQVSQIIGFLECPRRR